jgi:hypothetical protein
MFDEIELHCWLGDDFDQVFLVEIAKSRTVDELKEPSGGTSTQTHRCRHPRPVGAFYCGGREIETDFLDGLSVLGR